MATADVPACGLPRGRRKRRHPWRQLGALVCAGTVCGSFLAWTTFVSTAPPLGTPPSHDRVDGIAVLATLACVKQMHPHIFSQLHRPGNNSHYEHAADEGTHPTMSARGRPRTNNGEQEGGGTTHSAAGGPSPKDAGGRWGKGITSCRGGRRRFTRGQRRHSR